MGFVAIVVLPLLGIGIAVSRGPGSMMAVAPTPPTASFNIQLTSEQVERRIAGLINAPTLPMAPPAIERVTPGSIQLAALTYPSVLPHLPPPPTVSVPRFTLSLGTPSELHPSLGAPLVPVTPVDRPTIAAVEPSARPDERPDGRPESSNQCVARESASVSATPGATSFAQSLVAAALEQTKGVSIYQARYVRIPYPGGDVSPFYGVCTDVVIRAYRALGIDLQLDVQKARVGRGDTSIDHRRTETLRLFLARQGETLPVTDFAEDYQPGDIVTYYRPQNRSSTAHIAIVSDVLAPSGRPMIIHNRGFGVQLEDALFVDKITGHYRYRGVSEPLAVAAQQKTKSPSLARVAMSAPQSRPPGSALTRPTGISYAVPLGR